MTTSTNAIKDHLRKEIAAHGGHLSFADYMEIALYHPEFGYYNAEGFNLGKHGDFTTAPEITPLFAKCFARQCQQIFGAIEANHVLELGAGTGRFACDLMLELEELGAPPEQYLIYEISESLRKKQQIYIQTEHPTLLSRVRWLDSLPSDFKGVIIANEVLDALPVHCFHIDKTGIKERCVGWENDQLIWQLSDNLTADFINLVEELRSRYNLTPGYQSEINLNLSAFITAITSCLTQGVILLADYGYGQRELYHPERRKGTLTCFCEHRHHDDPLILPGQQDITAHVDFTRVVDIATDNGCTLEGYTTQAAFLLACGLLDMATVTATELLPADVFNLHQAIKTLTLPTEMGERIKVIALGKNFHADLMGFSMQDRRRDLIPPDAATGMA